MKKQTSVPMIGLLSVVFLFVSLASCDKDEYVLDKNIVGVWVLDKDKKECNVIASDTHSSEVIKTQLIDNYQLIYSDTILFTENGEFLEVDYHRGGTYQTRKNRVEITPPMYMSYVGYTFNYKIFDNKALVLSTVGDRMDYFCSNQYLNYIGLDTTKVSVQKIELSTTYNRIFY
jgi:hypothetical protein